MKKNDTTCCKVSDGEFLYYKYNILGLLKEINNITNLSESIGNFADLFTFKINYNTVTRKNTDTNEIEEVNDSYNHTVKKLYNGNIAETYWRTAGDATLRKYSYAYDHLNRLNDAYYQKPESNIEARNSYNETLTYDKNGNIMTLKRNGNEDGDLFAYQIDDLTYKYEDKSNVLMKVTDATNESLGFKDDSDGTNDEEDDYRYDDYGNMIYDQNKFITKIVYNHLNLPTTIDFSNDSRISYFYNAAGVKLKKVVQYGSEPEAEIITTDYLGGFQYQNNVLQFFPHPEGYVKSTPTAEGNPTYDYVYNYTDHLGNIRLSYTLDPYTNVLKILEENHYYPFGLKHTNYSGGKKTILKETEIDPKRVGPSADDLYKYKYNGKEWQDELGLNFYDYGARNYDPAIGRWMNIDPLAENSRRWNPYNYAYNNPIYFVDPDGMQAIPRDSYGRDLTKVGGKIEFYNFEDNLSSSENSNKRPGLYSDGDTNGSKQFDSSNNTIDKNNQSSNINGKDRDWSKYWAGKLENAKKWAKDNLVIEGSISGSIGVQVGGKTPFISGKIGGLVQEIGQVSFDFVNGTNSSQWAESYTQNFIEGSLGIKGTSASGGVGAYYNYVSPDGLNGIENGSGDWYGVVGIKSQNNLLPSAPNLNVHPRIKANTDCHCFDLGAEVRAIFGISINLYIGFKK
jgi:RHS repeat-associated protein